VLQASILTSESEGILTILMKMHKGPNYMPNIKNLRFAEMTDQN